jgi:hypothetical protein
VAVAFEVLETKLARCQIAAELYLSRNAVKSHTCTSDLPQAGHLLVRGALEQACLGGLVQPLCFPQTRFRDGCFSPG